MTFASLLAALPPRSARQKHYSLGLAVAVVLGLVLAAAIATALWHAPHPG